MRVLVTGAAGFIGSHLVERLLGDGHQVLGVDDLSSGFRANLDEATRGSGQGDAFSFSTRDVCDVALDETVREYAPEVICHLAAQISVRRSVDDPRADARTNVAGTVNLLEAAAGAGVRKVVFASSVACYGMPEVLPVPAGAATDPRSPYAASKLAGELYLNTYRALHGLDFTTLVLANVYGPRQTPEGEAGVVSIFVDALLRGEPTRVFGDGAQSRDYVYVGDVVDAFARACGGQGNGGRFNLGTGVRTTDVELHRVVAETVGVSSTPAYAPPRAGDLPAMAVDPGPADAGLGWRPRLTLADGVRATVNWHRSRLGATRL